MTSLFDLLSQNQENEKVISSLRKMSRQKRAAPDGAAPKTAGLPSVDSNNSFDEIIRDFTAIDVETTGLDPKSDRIIELGAVRYSRGKIQEEFSSFVNPGRPIPGPITRLTGISDADVSAAPLFAEIVESFLTFIGTVPLCGHQIDFDLNFLNSELKRAGREKLSSPEIDTALLSRIITPGIGRYSLKNLTNSLEIKLENAHRALDDARASGQAACALLARVSTVAPHIRAAMARFAPPSVIKSILFDSIRYKVDAAVNQPSLRLQISPKKLVPSSSRQTIGVETIRQVFAHTGKLAEFIPGFIERPSQTAMAQGVMEALNTGSIFIAEAGTGTGKSLAYLIPSAHYALKNNCRVLISTHTRNLQDQLISKDLPVVEKVLDEKLEYSVLKGRSNYLCIRQFYRLLSGDLADLSYRERMGMLPLIRWAMETKSGDIEEQNQFNIKWFSRIWRMLCADAHICEGKRCAEFADCYLQRARQSALGSHIVIINHALFFSELCSESSFLGSLGAIVFDEAHHLESCGHRYLRVEVDTNRCTQFIDNLVQIEKEMKKRPLPQMPEINEGDIKALVKRLRVATGAFLDDCLTWVESRHPPADEFQCAYGASVFTQTAGYAGLAAALAQTQHLLHQMQQNLESIDESKRDEHRILRQQVRLLTDKTSQLKADLEYVTGAVAEEHVFWTEGNRKKGWIKLCGVPLDVAAILSPLWQADKEACIFTSATLAVSRSLEYFKQKVGLTGPNEAKTRGELFASSFTPEQAFRGAVSGGPEPDSPEYPEYIASSILSITSALRKNILVLFTSLGMLEAVYARCKQLSFPAETTILAQGISGNRQAILDEFKQLSCAVLLGADSFWEGVDAPGKACELVLIPRLPFQVPTHPLTKALADRIEAQEGQSFFSYAVPEAIIKFRQGIGRLIRGAHDRGALIVLDKRIVTKNYGKKFCGSIEGGIRGYATVDEMLTALVPFFSDPGAPQITSLSYVPMEEME